MSPTTRRIASAATAVALGLTLAACGPVAGPAAAPATLELSAPPTGTAPTPDAATHNAADTEFAQMMIVHHEGAVEMAETVIKRASTAAIRDLGERIRAAQGPEIATMEGWLEDWGEPLPDAADHAPMAHDGMDMGGMDQAAAMAALDAADGADLDALFLQLMIEHHRGAIDMARAQLDAGQNATAVALAQQVIDAQEAEIADMEKLLVDSAL